MRLIGRAVRIWPLALLAAVWFGLLGPQILGGPAAYIIVSGTSMQPLLRAGDLAIARRENRYQVGDVIVYRIPEPDPFHGAELIHRIVGGAGNSGYLMRGDNASSTDQWQPTQADVVGKLWLTVPQLGLALAFLKSPLLLASLFAGFAFVLIVWPRAHEAPAAPAEGPDPPGAEETEPPA